MYMASSSSSMPPRLKYDVFLSFSGVDTRKKFTNHLFAALKQCGFIVFMDETELNRGEVISSELLRAIEESRISLIVFSESYAKSRWCLDELVKITECKKTLQQIVLPIFYDVDPSDLRGQKGSLAKAFANHEERFKDDIGTVEKWRAALTEAANLSGWDLQNLANGYEANFIENIVKEVENKLDLALLYVADHPVGLESRLQELNELLSMESNDVRIVGIWGIGGIGKTTIVNMLYNRIHRKFDGSSFLANVRETWEQPNGKVGLQEQLLLDIRKNGTHRIRNFYEGIEIIKRIASCRKVLLVLDDVDHEEQLKALAIDRGSFGVGSRIIVTTRDKHLLEWLQVDEIYKPMELDKSESLELFSWHAFKKVHPVDDFVEFSNEVVRYAGGLPLVLKVLGSFLFGRDIRIWESAIGDLRKIPNGDIKKKLKLSLDSLSTEHKDLFLDIACFFVGMDQCFKIRILESCNFLPAIGVQILVDRCLIKYECSRNHIVMHDMLRDIGREIVRLESLKEPGRRSRLWYYEDALEVLRDGTGTEAVEGLFLHLPKPKVVQVKANTFEKMNKLRLLGLDYVHLSTGYEHISKRLVWLRWKGFPLKRVPSNLPMENLVFLDLSYGSFKQIWKGKMNLVKLKFLYLSHCYYLKRTPNLSGLNNLEELLLNDCKMLVEIDESIRCLDKLLVLDMKNCKKLQKLPSSIWLLKSLECLDLSGSSKLEILSGFRGSPSELSYVSFLSSWRLRTKSVGSIQGLSFLKMLNMEWCNLSCLPTEIGNLISLRKLYLGGNRNLCAVPDSIGNLTCLEDLHLDNCNLSHLPSEIGNLVSLRELYLLNNHNLCAVPDSIGNLIRLKDLRLDNCNLSHLPSEIGRLISLQNLSLERNNNLCTVPDSICDLSSLEYLFLYDCNLSHLPSEIGRLISLQYLSLRGNNNLCTVPDSICDLSSLEYLGLNDCNFSHLPSEIGRLISLEHLTLDRNNNLCTVPDSICDLSSLKGLWLDDCNLSHLPSEIGKLTSLSSLRLKGNNFHSLPEGIGNLKSLVCLDLTKCARLLSLPQLPLSDGHLTVFANDCNGISILEYIYWLLHPHLLFSDGQQLIVNSFANNFRKDILLIKGQSVREKPIEIYLSGDEVPRWLMYQSAGSCLFFEVPPLDNQKILGFILGAVYRSGTNLYSSNDQDIILIFNNKTKGVVSDPVRTRTRKSDKDELLLYYKPLYYLRMHLEGGDEVEISIRFDKSNEGTFAIKKWGMNLLYEVEE